MDCNQTITITIGISQRQPQHDRGAGRLREPVKGFSIVGRGEIPGPDHGRFGKDNQMRTTWTRGRPGDFKMGLQCLGFASGIEFHGLFNCALNQRHFEWRTCGFSEVVMAKSKSASQYQ